MSPREKRRKDAERPQLQLLAPDGKPLKALSTSLGIALLANALYSAGTPRTASAADDAPVPAAGASASATSSASASARPAGPVLVEWSNDEVKAYFDPSVDWNIPLPDDDAEQATSAGTEGTGGSAGGGTGGTVIVRDGYSGFGWDDLLLYHLIMGRGGSYSSSAYYGSHAAYTSGGQAYKPRSFGQDAFRNKPVVGSSVRPKTSNSGGSITRRSTSSSAGGIGGKSSGFSSSGSGKSSGGFGG
ncbi:hypothetical protein [Cohnella zeiphila]|uniref:Uncharacterized protein n=1 Tax=Cohnella zeiphila TaxID=2761120 RepID=A0A7X0SKZ0_9BACL|nr:hypothetical protein [Cohnella zeiphila]MBB6731816.1 hypothetical protein [Cohnella zeiphila]